MHKPTQAKLTVYSDGTPIGSAMVKLHEVTRIPIVQAGLLSFYTLEFAPDDVKRYSFLGWQDNQGALVQDSFVVAGDMLYFNNDQWPTDGVAYEQDH